MRRTISSALALVALLGLAACSDDSLIMERLQALKLKHLTALAPLQPEPAADDVKAQYQQAKQYQAQGQFAAATRLISLCANRGHQPCIKELGYSYLQGVGVASDPYLGLQLLEHNLDTSDLTLVNDLAWFMATSRIQSLRNPKKALALMDELQQSQPLDAMTADTLAATQAALGNFKQAAFMQKKALNMLLRQGRAANNLLTAYRNRLSLYRNDKMYEE